MSQTGPEVAAVLLSGGMDSVLCLYMAHARYEETIAVHCQYGQPNGSAELLAARAAADRLGVPMVLVELGTAVSGVPTEAPPSGSKKGISLANMPARNMVLLAAAASAAGARWGDPVAHNLGKAHRVTIFAGPTFDDQQHFPDCRQPFEAAASKAAAAALIGLCEARVRFPWRRVPKWDVLKLCAKKWPDSLEAVRASVSCYGGNDCGQCDACKVRARAFAMAEMEDREGLRG